jgi:hypothetical protein
MPSSTDQLRQEFMSEDDLDGRHTAEQRIRDAGGTVNRGFITYTGNDDGTLRAAQFLIEEWDYTFTVDPGGCVP